VTVNVLAERSVGTERRAGNATRAAGKRLLYCGMKRIDNIILALSFA